MASIFDKIRLIYKKRVTDQTPQPKKLIAKSIVNKIDDLAVEFDNKLSQVMLALSKVLKEQTSSTSQKWAEIEKVKFNLQSYVIETAIKFLSKDKLSPKEQKDIHQILIKLKSCMARTFENVVSLFYSKEEKEV
jgi:excinuclease UvrABC ATPase subunit